MAKVKKSDTEGVWDVYTTEAPVESLEGTVYKREDEGADWESACHLDAGARFRADTKKEAVELLDDHFLKAHTTVYG
jgi:hypothetical protein